MNVITMAYLGDAIYELKIREYLINKGIVYVDELQKKEIDYVSAKSQVKILEYLINNNILLMLNYFYINIQLSLLHI